MLGCTAMGVYAALPTVAPLPTPLPSIPLVDTASIPPRLYAVDGVNGDYIVKVVCLFRMLRTNVINDFGVT